jgi:undecaprenyl-diphosphatase
VWSARVTLWEALLLGFVQGATEFLPVSSSGHLVVGQALLGLEISGVRFEVAVHVATLISVLVIYRTRLRDLLGGVIRGDPAARRYLGLLALATAPAAFIGVFYGTAIKALFENPLVPATAFLVTGSILWSTRWIRGGQAVRQLGARGAIFIGLAQAFALVPGISRSGSTVAMALWLPTIGGAALLQLSDLSSGDPSLSTAALVAGSVVAAVTGVVAIRAFVALLARRAFYRFGIYCWVLGVAFLIYLLV